MAARLPRLVRPPRPRAPKQVYRGPCLLCREPGSFSNYCTACSREYQRVRRAELAGTAEQGATLTWIRARRAEHLAKPSPDVQGETARQTG